MKYISKFLTFVFVFIASNLSFGQVQKQVDLIQIQGGTINPISAEFIINAIEKSEENQAQCIIIEMDTPGGLIAATQDIVKKELAANIPVVVFIIVFFYKD